MCRRHIKTRILSSECTCVILPNAFMVNDDDFGPTPILFTTFVVSNVGLQKFDAMVTNVCFA